MLSDDDTAAERTLACAYCNDLQPTLERPPRSETEDAGRRQRVFMPYAQWIGEVSGSSCPYCRVLLDAIRQLQPDFLDEAIHAGKDLRLSVYDNGRICISLSKAGWGRLEADIQFLLPGERELNTLQYNKEKWLFERSDEVQALAGTAATWAPINSWLDECLHRHPECTSSLSSSTWCPKRLLHISWLGSQQGTLVTLIYTDTKRSGYAYAALSHCWGGKLSLLNTMSTEADLLEGILWSDLPHTFQDAVIVTRNIGMHYIWIDSLCIKQDDRVDWAQHAECMDKVFQHAQLTIAATSSADSSETFLGTETIPGRAEWQAIPIVADVPGWPARLQARRCSRALIPGLVHGPLENRAWAWQERNLANRIVSFTEAEMKWKCNSGSACECSPIIRRLDSRNDSWSVHPEARTALRWREVVHDYSPRHLTFPSDRLPALAGAASRFAETLQSEYLAGLWKADFPCCLAWRYEEFDDTHDQPQQMRAAMPNSAPSWSWASIDVEVSWLDCSLYVGREEVVTIETEVQNCAELEGYGCRPSTANKFGEVREGSYLDVKARVVEAELEYDAYGRACVRRRGMAPQLVKMDCRLTGAKKPALELASDDERRSGLLQEIDLSSNVKRVLYHEDCPVEDERHRASVLCLLLYTERWKGKNYSYTLILSEIGADLHQRVGIGIGYDEVNEQRFDFDHREVSMYGAWKDKSAKWKGWETLSEWHEWEKWFADADVRTVRII